MDSVEAANTLMLMSEGCRIFSKVLTVSDARRELSRLLIPSDYARNGILAFCSKLQQEEFSEGFGCMLSVIDADVVYNGGSRNAVIQLLFQRWGRHGPFVFTTGWADYVERKGLMYNDVVRFWWNSHHSQFFISCEKSNDHQAVEFLTSSLA